MSAPHLPPPIIRDLQVGDLEAVSLLAKDLVELHHAWDSTRFFTTPDIAKGYRRWFESQLGVEGVVLLVAELDGAIAGYLYGSVEERDWAKLLDAHGAVHDVHVASTFRRRGVARALMLAAAERFRALGAGQMVLSSASANTEGQALFRSLGYRATMVEMTLDLR